MCCQTLHKFNKICFDIIERMLILIINLINLKFDNMNNKVRSKIYENSYLTYDEYEASTSLSRYNWMNHCGLFTVKKKSISLIKLSHIFYSKNIKNVFASTRIISKNSKADLGAYVMSWPGMNLFFGGELYVDNQTQVGYPSNAANFTKKLMVCIFFSTKDFRNLTYWG